MEAIYDDIPIKLGFGAFAPLQTARGPMFTARDRVKLTGEPSAPSVVSEEEAYASPKS